MRSICNACIIDDYTSYYYYYKFTIEGKDKPMRFKNLHNILFLSSHRTYILQSANILWIYYNKNIFCVMFMLIIIYISDYKLHFVWYKKLTSRSLLLNVLKALKPTLAIQCPSVTYFRGRGGDLDPPE